MPQQPDQLPAGILLGRVERRLEAPDASASAEFPVTGAPLLYVLDRPASLEQGVTVLSVMFQHRLRGGGTSKPRVLDLAVEDVALAPPPDRRWLSLLLGAGRPGDEPRTDAPPFGQRRPATFLLPSSLAGELLPPLVRTARAWLRPERHPADLVPLAWDDGEPWRVRVNAREIESGFEVDGEIHREGGRIRPTEPFLLVTNNLIAIRRTLARIEGGGEMAFLPELQAGPIQIPADDAPRLAFLFTRAGIDPDTMPDGLRTVEFREPPVPRLSLRRAASGASLSADVSFDYDGALVHMGTDPVPFFDTIHRRVIHRDADAEAAAIDRLEALGFERALDDGVPALQIPLRAVTPVAHALLGAGWRVTAEGARYQLPSAVRLAVRSGIDWFDLTATASFGNDTIALAQLLGAMRSGTRSIRLGDGSVGVLPETWLTQYAALTAAGEADGDRIRFNRAQATLVDALLAERDAEVDVDVDDTFARIRRELRSFSSIEPLDAPSSFAGSLRPYQRDGLGWFAFLRQFGFGGCLADDMGLGKTIMVLALLDSRRTAAAGDRRPSLVVVPRSLVGNWKQEAARFTPELRVVDASHATRDTAFESIDADVLIVTYGTLRRDIAALSGVQFDYVVLDEAQTIKNAATAAARAARLLRSRHRLALSGTPIENHLGELWSLFEFLNPGILGRSRVFQRATARPDAETTGLISKGLKPFVLRRTKAQVATDLPPRTEQTLVCELGPRERAAYDVLRRHYRGVLLDRITRDGLSKSRMHVLEALLRLRQAACHTGLIDPQRQKDGSAKFDVLLPRLQEVIAEGHKAIVFSQFTALLALLRTELDAARTKYEYLDGRTRDRASHVERFQTDPDVPLFLVSLKAGGLGLNLTAAGYVFLLDPWWNPAVEAQAIDRAHRIGQTREVFAYRLIARDTVEEKVLALQASKRDLADAVLSADAVGLRHLEREDLELLLS